MRNHQPTKAQVEAQADWVAAFGEPTRLRIIHALVTGEKVVTELAKLVGTEIVNVSHHLGVLKAAGVVAVERDRHRPELTGEASRWSTPVLRRSG